MVYHLYLSLFLLSLIKFAFAMPEDESKQKLLNVLNSQVVDCGTSLSESIMEIDDETATQYLNYLNGYIHKHEEEDFLATFSQTYENSKTSLKNILHRDLSDLELLVCFLDTLKMEYIIVLSNEFKIKTLPHSIDNGFRVFVTLNSHPVSQLKPVKLLIESHKLYKLL